MQRTPPFPFLPDLEMPLRDAMRGVATFAEATEEALEPAARLLPEPLRAGFHRGVKSIERTGKRLIDQGLQTDQILTASHFASGTSPDPGASKTFAKVVCFAWEHLQSATHGPRFMISETILAGKSAQHAMQGQGATNAAALLSMIRGSHAIGRMPGLADGIGAAERNHIDLMLVAIMVWLLATRAHGLDEDLTLLDLALALVTAIKAEVAAAKDDPAKLAQILDASSAHL